MRVIFGLKGLEWINDQVSRSKFLLLMFLIADN